MTAESGKTPLPTTPSRLRRPRLAQLERFRLVSVRDLITTAGPALLLTVLVLWLAYLTIDPTPPKRVVLATGPENSAYDVFGKRYRAALAAHGIDVVLQESQGSVDNFQRLKRGTVDIAFLQSGTTNEDESSSHGLSSLGSLFVEPLWIFYRDAALPRKRTVAASDGSQAALNRLTQLRGLRVNVGVEGSGVPQLFRQLLSANRIEGSELQLGHLEPTPAVMALLEGSIDALVFSSAPDAPLIQMLLQTPGVGLYHFDQAEAYARRFPFLSHVVLPRGIVSLEQDRPRREVHLIAPTATLVARADIHPAIVDLLVQAGGEIHGGTGWFRRAGEFPSSRYTEIPLADEAARFYKSGPPLLQRYLPFWLANLIERMWVILIPLIALLVPLSRILPPLYEWRVRSRVYRWYGQLREVELHMTQPENQTARLIDAQLERLERIETAVNQLIVPLSYADEVYALRSHINLVRLRLQERAAS